MGKLEASLKEFTEQHILDKPFVLKMLQYEDQLYLSDKGQEIVGSVGMHNISSLEGGKTIQRQTLRHFGFDPSSQNLKRYRTIFHHYYISSTDYDKDILQSVYYLRANRCLYYTTPYLKLGDHIPDVPLYDMTNNKETSVYSVLSSNKNPHQTHTILASFSSS